MNIKDHHTIPELQTLYRKENDARENARGISGSQGIKLSSCRVENAPAAVSGA